MSKNLRFKDLLLWGSVLLNRLLVAFIAFAI
jgi:hypothetical protein